MEFWVFGNGFSRTSPQKSYANPRDREKTQLTRTRVFNGRKQ
jgi:hypothetical protein